MVISLSVSTLADVCDTFNGNETCSHRLDDKIVYYINAYIDIYGDNNVRVSDIKTAYDFCGNEYKVIECEPTGYFIMVPESGMLTEFSCTSDSPYSAYTNEKMFYAGPTYYYVLTSEQNEDVFMHTIETDSYLTRSTVDSFRKKCEEIYTEYRSMVVPLARKYFLGDINEENLLMGLEDNHSANPSPLYMPNASWFTSHSSGFGYVSGGCCGYIAANLLLKYWHHSVGAISLPSNHATINSTVLTNNLLSIGSSLGYGYSLYASNLKNIMNQYLSTNNVAGSATYALFAYNVYNELNNNRPVVLFGSLYDPQNPSSNTNHAVVAYSYYYASDGYLTFRCHYGWNGYANISVSSSNSTIGEHMRYNPYS